MTPEQLFEHRLASLLGLTLDQLDLLPERERQRWAMYWAEEPWGAYRDNLHASLIVTEVLAAAAAVAGDRNWQKPPLSAFMFETAQERIDRQEREREMTKLRIQALARIAARKPKKSAPRSRSRG